MGLRYPDVFKEHGCCTAGADGGIRTPDQLITNQLLWPTELHRPVYKTTEGNQITLNFRFANV